jgi:hypothetical protein
MVQRPGDLDIACSLACFQEEVLDGLSYADPPRQLHLMPPPQQLLLPAPPAHVAPLVSVQAQDRRGTEASRASDVAGKISALKTYHKARGLCFKYGEWWGREHTCPSSVQLHVLEEMMEFMGIEEQQEGTSADRSPETVMAISY